MLGRPVFVLNEYFLIRALIGRLMGWLLGRGVFAARVPSL
jgi:hypothetical protein